MISEIERNPGKPSISRGVALDDLQAPIAALNQPATIVETTHVVAGIAAHPKDNLVLAAAVSADVDYFETVDKMLLQLGNYLNVNIVSSKQFLAFLDPETGLSERSDVSFPYRT